MKRACLSIFMAILATSPALAQDVKLKVRAALYDRDLNLKPVPHMTVKLVPADAAAEAVTLQTSLDGLAEADLHAGKYHLTTEPPVELFDKMFKWEFDTELVKPENILELSNDNSLVAPIAGGREARVDELAYQYKRVKDAVVTVWTEYGVYDGFVVDPAGLVLTVGRPLEQAGWLAVQLDDRRRLPAVIVASDKQRDVAVLRINPSATGQISSVELSTDPGALVEGERVFTIDNPGREKSKKLLTGVLTRADADEIISDIRVSNAGSPLFNSTGKAVGLVQRSGDAFRIAPIGLSSETIEGAKRNLNQATPPPSRLLPTLPSNPFPADSLPSLARDRWEKDVYFSKAGDFEIEFVTPVSRYENDSQSFEQQQRAFRKGKGRGVAPAEPDRNYDATLGIAVYPKTKMPFWENLVQAEVTDGQGPSIMRYKTGFLRMRLLCGENEVDPVWPHRVVEGEHGDPYSVVVDQAYGGRYTYAHNAISPECGKMVLQIFSTRDPEHPVEKVLDDKVVSRLWRDFEPYRKMQQ